MKSKRWKIRIIRNETFCCSALTEIELMLQLSGFFSAIALWTLHHKNGWNVCQDFKLKGVQFYVIKQLKNSHPNFKDLLF